MHTISSITIDYTFGKSLTSMYNGSDYFRWLYVTRTYHMPTEIAWRVFLCSIFYFAWQHPDWLTHLLVCGPQWDPHDDNDLKDPREQIRDLRRERDWSTVTMLMIKSSSRSNWSFLSRAYYGPSKENAFRKLDKNCCMPKWKISDWQTNYAKQARKENLRDLMVCLHMAWEFSVPQFTTRVL